MRPRNCAVFVMTLVVVFSFETRANAGGHGDKKGKQAATAPAPNSDEDRIFYQEALLVENVAKYSPLVETYIQNLKPDAELGQVPASDAYFLGRLVLNKRGLGDKNFEGKSVGLKSKVMDRLTGMFKMNYLPLGFMQLVFLNNNFDKDHYQLKFLRQQFLGEVKTKVYDVSPRPGFKGPHFLGRIWVEDQDYNIVRINGTYEPHSGGNFYFHFDTWRMNMQPGVWLPAYVYTEETDTKYLLVRKLAMKGQTRLWGYSLRNPSRADELTAVEVDPNEEVTDHSEKAANEFNPIGSEHMWRQEAEDNVIDRLERAGLIAPHDNVSKVLQTVVNNLMVTNNLNFDGGVRCRVLLTMPLESFTIGHTIILSRGLLDVLPDEAALAAVLAHELAHIALGHALNTKYAFSDRMIFPDEQSFRRLEVARTQREEQEADTKATELLQKSPYQTKLQSAALFMRALESESPALRNLISPRFGNQFAKSSELLRMRSLAQSSPALEKENVAQIAALPLGSRIKLDPWDDHLEMKNVNAVIPESARDKMAFEVTPAFLNLVRYGAVESKKSAENRAEQ